MWKKWCIKYYERGWFGRKHFHHIEFEEKRVDSALKTFHMLKPNAVILEIYVEYIRRK